MPDDPGKPTPAVAPMLLIGVQEGTNWSRFVDTREVVSVIGRDSDRKVQVVLRGVPTVPDIWYVLPTGMTLERVIQEIAQMKLAYPL